MQSFRVLLVVAALALFGAGVLLTRALVTPAPVVPAAPAVEAVPTRQVLVAARDLGAGQFLDTADFTWADRPENTLRPDLYLNGSDSVAPLDGAVLLKPLKAGEAVVRGGVVSPRERGFLAAVLPPDKRSISVAVDEVAGNAGLIFPGDHVDLLLTKSDPKAEDPAHQVMGQIVLEDVRVVAVDQAMRGPSEEAAREGKDGKAPVTAQGMVATARQQAARTVTLEVTPRQAELVGVAVTLGKVTLVLRSMALADRPDPADAGARPVMWAGDVLRPLAGMRAPKAEAAPAEVELLRGGAGKK